MIMLGVALLLDIVWLAIYSTVKYIYKIFSLIQVNLMQNLIILNLEYKNIK